MLNIITCLVTCWKKLVTMGIIQELFVILNIYEYRSNVSATIPANIGYTANVFILMFWRFNVVVATLNLKLGKYDQDRIIMHSVSLFNYTFTSKSSFLYWNLIQFEKVIRNEQNRSSKRGESGKVYWSRDHSGEFFRFSIIKNLVLLDGIQKLVFFMNTSETFIC